jgi:hypothetical protein
MSVRHADEKSLMPWNMCPAESIQASGLRRCEKTLMPWNMCPAESVQASGLRGYQKLIMPKVQVLGLLMPWNMCPAESIQMSGLRGCQKLIMPKVESFRCRVQKHERETRRRKVAHALEHVPCRRERGFFLDNLLVQIYCIYIILAESIQASGLRGCQNLKVEVFGRRVWGLGVGASG